MAGAREFSLVRSV